MDDAFMKLNSEVRIEREYAERRTKETNEAFAGLAGFSAEAANRLRAAKDVLHAKGYAPASVELGLKVLGEWSPTFWIQVPNIPHEWRDLNSFEDALRAIEAAAEAAPDKRDIDAAKADALSKLSESERRILGI